MTARSGLVGMLCLAVLVGGGLISCGLPSLTFIDGPRSDSVEVDRSLSLTVFEHNAQANDIDAFKGYELYYKLFPYDAGNDSAYESDVAYITEDPPVTGTSRLTSRGYTRVSAADADARPLIAVAFENRDQSFEISVSFNQSNPGGDFDGAATVAWNGNTVRLNRSATDTAGNSKPFFPINTSVYDVGGDGGADDEIDADLSDLDNPAQLVDQEDLAVGLFALGYGQDGTTFEIIYSEPTELGWFKLQ
jgi:hypothetical protein